MRLTLPYPPTANLYWRHNRGRIHLSDDAKRYRTIVWAEARRCSVRKIDGDVAIILDVYRPRKSGDLDNTMKVLLDALRGLAYADDRQITHITARRFDDKRNPRAEIQIMPFGEAPCSTT